MNSFQSYGGLMTAFQFLHLSKGNYSNNRSIIVVVVVIFPILPILFRQMKQEEFPILSLINIHEPAAAQREQLYIMMNEVFLLQYMHYLCVFEVQSRTEVEEILIFLLLRLRKLMNNERIIILTTNRNKSR